MAPSPWVFVPCARKTKYFSHTPFSIKMIPPTRENLTSQSAGIRGATMSR